jgi:hypothetical protein
MERDKIAFENDFKDVFDEIWLVRLLYNFWYNFIPWNSDDIKVGMIFGFELCSRTILHAEDAPILLKHIGKSHVVTMIIHGWSGPIVHFQPVVKSIGLSTNDTNTWCIYAGSQNSGILHYECPTKTCQTIQIKSI